MAGPLRNALKPNSRANTGHARGAGIIHLPASGCDLPIPPLPKQRDWSADERKMWRNLWRSPQAVQWDDSFIAAVAAYVVHATAVYSGTAAAWAAQEMRHLGQQLGLTPAGLQALGWVIVDGE